MAQYLFKLKKGELEVELRSNDPQFIELQLENWREALAETTSPTNNSQPLPQNA
jgi:hypothetical protein